MDRAAHRRPSRFLSGLFAARPPKRRLERGPTKDGEMKIGVIGVGAVGSACVLATVMRGCAREIVLLNRGRERAKAVATDMQYGAPLSGVARSGNRRARLLHHRGRGFSEPCHQGSDNCTAAA